MSEINCFGDEEVYGEVIPHWYLVRLVNKIDRPYMVGHFEMKEGSWGLTYVNDPSFIFDLVPMKDPGDDLPDDMIFAKDYLDALDHYEDRLQGVVRDGYRLMNCCIEAGFDFEEGGFACWLMDRMAKFLEEKEWKPERVYRRVGN